MKKYLLLTAVIAVVAVCAYFYIIKTTDLSFHNSETQTTATRLDKIKEIGEWEFMTISDEQIVDTVAITKHTWPIPDSRKQLARIYKGTLRIGFNLKTDVKPDWIVEKGDTVDVILPKMRLLDERFIDEAASRPLIEDGKWTLRDRDLLYAKAVRKMKAENLTSENLRQAESSAVQQMNDLLHSVGFKVISVRVDH